MKIPTITYPRMPKLSFRVPHITFMPADAGALSVVRMTIIATIALQGRSGEF